MSQKYLTANILQKYWSNQIFIYFLKNKIKYNKYNIIPQITNTPKQNFTQIIPKIPPTIPNNKKNAKKIVIIDKNLNYTNLIIYIKNEKYKKQWSG